MNYHMVVYLNKIYVRRYEKSNGKGIQIMKAYELRVRILNKSLFVCII